MRGGGTAPNPPASGCTLDQSPTPSPPGEVTDPQSCPRAAPPRRLPPGPPPAGEWTAEGFSAPSRTVLPGSRGSAILLAGADVGESAGDQLQDGKVPNGGPNHLSSPFSPGSCEDWTLLVLCRPPQLSIVDQRTLCPLLSCWPFSPTCSGGHTSSPLPCALLRVLLVECCLG